MPILASQQRKSSDPEILSGGRPDRQDRIGPQSRALSHLDRGRQEIPGRSSAEDPQSASFIATGTSSLGWNFAAISLRPISTPYLQTKLTINQPGDPYEQEADHVAEQVMHPARQGAAVTVSSDSSKGIRRACACGGTCNKCKEEDEQGHLQRKAASAARAGPATAPPSVSEVLSSPGQALDSATQAYMEPRFGFDFSGVRVHADDRASDSAQALHARAYTVGSHIVFSNREPSPASPAAWPLMAHELTHVV